MVHHRSLSASFFHKGPLLISVNGSCGNGIVDLFGRLLLQSSTLLQTKQLHAQIIAHGTSSSSFLSSTLISLYASYGLLLTSTKVFHFSSNAEASTSSSLVSNSMLRAFISHGKHAEAITVYQKMLETQTRPDSFTFPLAIRASSNTGSFHLCNIVHSHATKMGFQSHLHVCNELLSMFCRRGVMIHALKLFDRMPVKTHVSWNTMLSGFALARDCDAAAAIFRRMDGGRLKPNQVTWTSLLSSHSRCNRHREVVEMLILLLSRGDEPNAESLAVVISACSQLHSIETGRAVQGYVIKAGFEEGTCVKNSIISMYGRHRLTKEAERAFLEMGDFIKDIVSWNTLISCYSECGMCEEAFRLLSELGGDKSDGGLRPNVVSWSSVMDGFVRRGRWEESLVLFREMQSCGVRASSVSVLIVLIACVELGGRGDRIGREVHGHAVRGGGGGDCLVVNGLVNMYSKSGRVREAYLVFKNCEQKDIVSWNSMITGLGMHGGGVACLRMFDELLGEGMAPDEVTFVALLSACSHAGLVREGGEIFKRMVEEHGVVPKREHYGCMVDLFGRAGLIGEAAEMLEIMPVDIGNVCAWGAFLNSCGKHGDADAAKGAADKIFEIGLEMGGGSYMLMSNIYAASGRWEEAALVRRSAKAKGLKKVAGESWVEIHNKIHIFSSHTFSQGSMLTVFATLEGLSSQMEKEDWGMFEDFVA